MKRLFVASILLLATSYSFAVEVWRSSYTATADTTLNLCINKRGTLHSIVVSSAGVNSTISVFASSGTVFSTMTVLDTTSKSVYPYDVILATRTGLTYSTAGTTQAQLTILYNCY